MGVGWAAVAEQLCLLLACLAPGCTPAAVLHSNHITFVCSCPCFVQARADRFVGCTCSSQLKSCQGLSSSSCQAAVASQGSALQPVLCQGRYSIQRSHACSCAPNSDVWALFIFGLMCNPFPLHAASLTLSDVRACNYSLTRARARGFTPTDWERILAGSEQQTRGGCASGGAAPWNSKQQLQKRQAALGRPCKQAATGVQQHCTPVITRHAGCTALLSNAADIP